MPRLFNSSIHTIANLASDSCVKKRLIGAGWLRIIFGATTTIMFALHFHQRHVLWGPLGVVTPEDNANLLAQGRAWTLYQWFPSAAGAEFLYWAGLAISVCFALGLFTSITKFLFFVSTWSLYQRDYYAIDGGENLLIVLAVYLLFTDLSALSVDRLLRNREPGKFSKFWLWGMLHNYGILACLIQISILYFISGFFKVRGHVWGNGTALYYILRTNEFSLPGWTDYIIGSPLLITLGTYFTIIFELMYPWLIWHPKFKYLITVGAIFLHSGIGLFMGLPWFSLTMVGVHVLLFEDSEYERAALWWREWRSRPRASAMPQSDWQPGDRALDPAV